LFCSNDTASKELTYKFSRLSARWPTKIIVSQRRQELVRRRTSREFGEIRNMLTSETPNGQQLRLGQVHQSRLKTVGDTDDRESNRQYGVLSDRIAQPCDDLIQIAGDQFGSELEKVA
jgi:hypothetical protein